MDHHSNPLGFFYEATPLQLFLQNKSASLEILKILTRNLNGKNYLFFLKNKIKIYFFKKKENFEIKVLPIQYRSGFKRYSRKKIKPILTIAVEENVQTDLISHFLEKKG